MATSTDPRSWYSAFLGTNGGHSPQTASLRSPKTKHRTPFLGCRQVGASALKSSSYGRSSRKWHCRLVDHSNSGMLSGAYLAFLRRRRRLLPMLLVRPNIVATDRYRVFLPNTPKSICATSRSVFLTPGIDRRLRFQSWRIDDLGSAMRRALALLIKSGYVCEVAGANRVFSSR